MQSWKHFLFLVFSTVILFPVTSQIYGQRVCLPALGYQDLPYWRANFVFTGVAEKFAANGKSVSPDKITITDSYQPVFNRVRFAVEKEYRGIVDRNIEIISNFNFKEGERYFIYAVAGKDGEIYQLDSGECGKPPVLLQDAKDDIEYAEEIASGKIGTRIFGFVFEDSQRLGSQRQNVPLADVEVKIKKGKNFFTTQTDSEGKYIFKNVPIGEYQITVSTPDGLHEKFFSDSYFYQRGVKPSSVVVGESMAGQFITLGSTQKPKTYYRHSDSYNFIFTSLSSIEGKTVGSNGKVPPQQYVWLVPIFNGKADLDDYIQYVWTNPADGKFVFEDIPEGEYIIVVNRYNCHSNNHPEQARNFFPGVADLSSAETITVGENQNTKIKDFRLSPPLKERLFSGIVLAADQSPLANAAVFLITSDQKNPNECFSVNIETKTDKFGRFQLKGYENYKYKIRAYIQPTGQNSSRLFSNILEFSVKDKVENIELIVDSKY